MLQWSSVWGCYSDQILDNMLLSNDNWLKHIFNLNFISTKTTCKYVVQKANKTNQNKHDVWGKREDACMGKVPNKDIGLLGEKKGTELPSEERVKMQAWTVNVQVESLSYSFYSMLLSPKKKYPYFSLSLVTKLEEFYKLIFTYLFLWSSIHLCTSTSFLATK